LDHQGISSVSEGITQENTTNPLPETVVAIQSVLEALMRKIET